MEKPEDLSPQQDAALKLLSGGMDIASIAQALGVDQPAVKRQLLDGITLLAGENAKSLTESERGELADWLTGQIAQSRLAEDSPAASRFISSVRESLPGLPPGVGATGGSIGSDDAEMKPNQVTDERSASTATGKLQDPPPAVDKAPRKATVADSVNAGSGSRKGGIILITATGVLVLGLGLWGFGVFNGSSDSASSSSGKTVSEATSQQSANDFVPKSKTTFALRAKPKGKVEGLVGFGTKGGQPALLVAATGLPREGYAGIWLVAGSGSRFLGAVRPDAQGNFRVTALVPPGAARSTSLIITRQPYTPGGAVPSRPGPVLLSTEFSA